MRIEHACHDQQKAGAFLSSKNIPYKLGADGKPATKKAIGLLARIFQHEIDHLDGILFTDKATELRNAKDDKSNTEL